MSVLFLQFISENLGNKLLDLSTSCTVANRDDIGYRRSSTGVLKAGLGGSRDGGPAGAARLSRPQRELMAGS